MLTSSLIKDQSNDTTQDKTKNSQKFIHTHRDILADNGNNNKDRLRVIDTHTHDDNYEDYSYYDTTTMTHTHIRVKKQRLKNSKG